MGTFDDRDLREQVERYLAGFSNDFDADGVVAEIQDTYGLVDIDTIPSAAFNAILERHPAV